MAATSNRAVSSATKAVSHLSFAVLEATDHALPGHVERPQRVSAVLQALEGAGLLSDPQVSRLSAFAPISMAEVDAVHSYGELLKATVESEAPAAVADIGDPDGVTYVTPSSWGDALAAAGAAVALVDDVVARSRRGGRGAAGFSVARPPGHHATADTALGYCLLNNVALAARHAQRAHGLGKVLVLDWDVHHGNGTSDVFADDPSVLFIDFHEASATYPSPPFAHGGAEDVGTGAGRGYTINVPLPRRTGHEGALAAFDRVVTPAARRFRPDIILVSAGYDAHHRDPFQLLAWRSATYRGMAARLASLAGELCGGRLVLLLEGGYEVEAVGEAVAETWRGLLGLPGAAEEGAAGPLCEAPAAEVAELLDRVCALHGLAG